MTFREPKTWRGRVTQTDLNREVRDQFRELRSAVSALEAGGGGGGGATIPVGMILLSGRTDVPTGYLVCDGQTVAYGTYPDLYDICGSAYGPVTSTTFVLPDLTNRFLRGASAAGDGTISSRGSSGGYTNNNGDIASGTLTWSSVSLGDTSQGSSHAHNVDTSHAHNFNHSHASGGQTVSGFTGSQTHDHPANSHDHGGNTPGTNTANRGSGSSTPNVSPAHTHGFTASSRATNSDAHSHGLPSSSGVNLTSNNFGSSQATGSPTNVNHHSHATSHTHDATHNHLLADKRPEFDDVNWIIKAVPETGEGEDWFIAGSAILGTSMIGA